MLVRVSDNKTVRPGAKLRPNGKTRPVYTYVEGTGTGSRIKIRGPSGRTYYAEVEEFGLKFV